MTVDEIFSELSAHMVEGLMVHAQMSDYYGFLGLKGYQKCHKYHYFEENIGYRKISEYYIKHYNKVIVEKSIDNPRIIPDSWYQYNRHDVNSNTRKTAIQNGMDKWVQWEKGTKKLYEKLYQELMTLGETASALEVSKYIEDVSKELAHAEEKLIELKAMDYDIYTIIDNQESIHDKYKKKLKEIEL